METLFKKHDRLLALTSTAIIREMMNQVNWEAPMIAIRGPRGVGKSTLLLQYIKTHYEPYSREVLYCQMDSVYFSSHTLLDLAERFYQQGGQRLLLDEVHKYPTWSRELKEIYDLYPDMKVVFSSSSLLNVLQGDADLSRRCIPYDMQGLSLREFLLFYKGISIRPRTLEEALTRPASLCQEVNSQCRILACFHEYLQYGYYPFYLRNQTDYYTTIEQVVNYIIDVELPQLCGVDVANCRKLKALMGILASSVPYEVDISKLATTVQVHRNTILGYLNDMGRAKLINLLYADIQSVKKMQKPDKIYMENANLLYALSSGSVDIGTAREAFVVNQLSHLHQVEYSKKNGDFRIDGKYTVEVGGENKSFGQIAGVADSFVLADNIEAPLGRKLPLWVVGFLY